MSIELQQAKFFIENNKSEDSITWAKCPFEFEDINCRMCIFQKPIGCGAYKEMLDISNDIIMNNRRKKLERICLD